MKPVRYRPLFWLTLLGFAITAVGIAFLPDEVPLHFNAAGIADRYGSPYELLLLPALTGFMALLFWVIGRRSRSQAGLERLVVIAGCGTLLLFDGITVWALWLAASSGGLSSMTDTLKLVVSGAGLLLTFLCNLMPKAPMNAVFGVRTVWSMNSEAVWAKSQRFGGYTGMACGLLVLLGGVLLPGWAGLLAMGVLVIVWAALSVAASWYFSKKIS